MKRNIIGALTLSSLLLLGACSQEATEQVNTPSEVEAAGTEVQHFEPSVGIVDDVNTDRLVVTLESSDVLDGKSNGQRIVFHTSDIDEATLSNLKRGQKVEITHDANFTRSLPPQGNATAVKMIDVGMSEQPNITVFTMDKDTGNFKRSNPVVGASMATITSIVEQLDWQDEEFTAEQSPIIQFSIENGNTPVDGDLMHIWKVDDHYIIQDTVTEKFAAISGSDALKIKELMK